MLNARNQVRWYEEEWRRKNEEEVVERESEEVVVKDSEEVVVKDSEEVVERESEEVVVKESEEDEEAAKIAENLAKHVEKLRKYFARTTESTTMEIPVHRQKATR
jgi:hypothetical protein